MRSTFSFIFIIALILCPVEGKAWEANYDEGKIPKYTLPDPLVMADGSKVTSQEQWHSKRRGEILELFKKHIYGVIPGAMKIAHVERDSFIDDALSGKARLLQESFYFKKDRSGPKIDVCVFLPPKSKKVEAYPAFLALNFFGNHTIHTDENIRMYTGHARLKPGRGGRGTKWAIEDIVSRGYAIVTACYNNFDIDHRLEGPKFDDGVHQLYPEYHLRSDNWASIGAWAWGMSRVLDYLEGLEFVDAKRVVAMGHSRLGKTALWAGATDERFALVISNNSGCGGAAMARRRIGENIWRINTSFPHWFCAKHKEYNDNENAMPVDQHMLISLIAPRPVYVASATEDRWADPRGEFLSCIGADGVYKLLKTSGLTSHEWPKPETPIVGRISYHLRNGKHDVTKYDWAQYLDFADRYLKQHSRNQKNLNHESTLTNNLEAGFASPPHSSGIRAFWWWLNGNVTKDAITRDLEEMKDKGFNGALIFDADGSSQQDNRQVPAGPLFGCDEWTELFVHACKEAKRLDLELSLNIQSGWNLGGPKVNAEEATQQLVWSKTDVKGPVKIEQVLANPKSKDFYKDVAVIAVLVSGITTDRPIKDLNLKSSTRELGMSAPDCRGLLNTDPAKAGEVALKSKDVINVTAKMDKNSMLRWNVPKGEWVVLRFGHTATRAHVSTCSASWGGRVLDYMNPKSLEAYWGRNVEPLFKAIGPMAGTTMRYVHTDSWEGGGMNWTPGFDKAFKKNRGYDPLPWLAVIAGYVVNSREDSNAFLADFRKTIGDLVADHYGLLAELAQKYGIGTHPECSGPHAGPLDGLKNYGRSELMMSEFWSPSPHRPNPPDRFFVKQASSAAHTYGKRLVGAEAFTTIGPHWNDVPWSAMKPSFDHEFCAGLNLVFNHTFTCSPKEMGFPGQEYFAGTHFNSQITWWDQAPAFIDYMKRCQYLAQQGDFVADVVYYYGDHVPNIARRKGDDPAGALGGYDYDVLSEELLVSSMKVKKGRVTLPSGMKYRVLVLPDHKVLSLKALKKVDKLVRTGGTVLGPKPVKAVSLEGRTKGKKLFQKLSDGLWGKSKEPKGIRKVGKGRVAWGMTANELLEADGIAHDAVFTDKGMASAINWIHYRIDGADIYFLSEPNGKARNVNAIFRVDGRVPEIWDAVDGSIRQANTFKFVDECTAMPLEFDEFGSMFVVFRDKAKRDCNDGPNFPTWKQKQVIAGPWDVSFDSKWGDLSSRFGLKL